MRAELRGPVRFVYKPDGADLEIVLEGDASWVRGVAEDLGIGERGWVHPMALTQFRVGQSTGLIAEPAAHSSMGPEPNPSSIPVVLRPIGGLDIEEKLKQYGASSPEEPSIAELAEEFECLEMPEPKKGSLVTDPMSEAWLAELLRIAIKNHGVTSLAVDVIEEVASDRLGDRTGMELELWLENMFRAGKLMKISIGNKTCYGPVPAWLSN